MSPLVYVIVFAMASFKTLSDVQTVTGQTVRDAAYNGVMYCFVAFLLSIVVGGIYGMG